MGQINEIVDFQLLTKAINSVGKELDITGERYLKLVKDWEDGGKRLNGSAVNLNNFAAAQKETAKNTKELDTLNKQLGESEKKLKQIEDGRFKTIVQNKIAIQENTKAVKDQIKAEQAAEGSLVRMRQKLIELQKAYDSAGNRTKEAADEISNLSKEIQEAEEATNRHQRNVGNYRNSLEGLTVKIKDLTSAQSKLDVTTKEGAQEYKKIQTEINNTKKEITNYTNVTNNLDKSLGGASGKIGALANSASALPGPIGNAVSSIQTMGKSLWALVANPIGATIAVIVGALALLYKAFMSTDSGATKMAGAMKAIGNIMDVLIDRAVSYYKTLWSLVTFDWKGVKENGTKAFGGLGKAIKDATNAGWDYAHVMDDIADREAASLTRTEKLRKESVELTIASKNRMLGSKEQIRLAEEAMSKELEANNIELGFLKERTEAEKNNLSSKINNSKLTLEDKQKQVEKWLEYDDVTLKSAMENDKAFAEFYNNNEAGFQALQKAKAEEIGKDSEANERTRRMQTSMFTFKEELYNEGVAAAKEARAKEIENAETANKKEIELINQRYIDGIITDEQYKEELLKNEESYLKIKQTFYKSDTKEFADIQLQLQDIAISRIDEVKKHEEVAIKQSAELLKEALKEEEDAMKAAQDGEMKDAEDFWKKKAEAEKKAEEDRLEMKKEILNMEAEIASEALNGLFDLNSAKLDRELESLDKEKEAKLSNKNLTEAQKLQIEEDYDKKAAAVKTKQAKADKLQAMFNIALSTAMGIANATSKVVTLPLVPFIAALGAVQLALAMAQPIPKFKHGTKDAPGAGIFGEAGRELMFLRSGETMLANEATYFEGSKFKGAKILSNPETERLIKMDHTMGGRQMTDARIINELRSVKKAIMNKPVMIFDKENRAIGQQTSHSQTIYLNRLIR